MGLNHEQRKSLVIGRPNMVEGSGAYFTNRKAIKTRSSPQRFDLAGDVGGEELAHPLRKSLVPQTNSF